MGTRRVSWGLLAIRFRLLNTLLLLVPGIEIYSGPLCAGLSSEPIRSSFFANFAESMLPYSPTFCLAWTHRLCIPRNAFSITATTTRSLIFRMFGSYSPLQKGVPGELRYRLWPLLVMTLPGLIDPPESFWFTRSNKMAATCAVLCNQSCRWDLGPGLCNYEFYQHHSSRPYFLKVVWCPLSAYRTNSLSANLPTQTSDPQRSFTSLESRSFLAKI